MTLLGPSSRNAWTVSGDHADLVRVPPPGDVQVAKHRVSSFWDTPLDAILRNLRLGTEHVVENTGAGKLYCLTMMTPKEGFAH